MKFFVLAEAFLILSFITANMRGLEAMYLDHGQ